MLVGWLSREARWRISLSRCFSAFIRKKTECRKFCSRTREAELLPEGLGLRFATPQRTLLSAWIIIWSPLKGNPSSDVMILHALLNETSRYIWSKASIFRICFCTSSPFVTYILTVDRQLLTSARFRFSGGTVHGGGRASGRARLMKRPGSDQRRENENGIWPCWTLASDVPQKCKVVGNLWELGGLQSGDVGPEEGPGNLTLPSHNRFIKTLFSKGGTEGNSYYDVGKVISRCEKKVILHASWRAWLTVNFKSCSWWEVNSYLRLMSQQKLPE